MSHWLDDAARGLSEGKLTRRAVLRRGGAVAGGAVLASLTSPIRPLTRAAAATGTTGPCPKLPCQPPELCCGGKECCNTNTHTCCEGLCIEDGDPSTGCCGGLIYARKFDTCCGGRRCQNTRGPFKLDNFCCGGECHKRNRKIGCCNGQVYRVDDEQCCPQADKRKREFHLCPKREECCGATECCKKGEQCCNSGKLRYCAPRGRCCPKGQHRVKCGAGKAMCCPEDQFCCGGKCCKPADCRNGVCRKGCGPFGSCPSGQFCCGEGGPNERCVPNNHQCCAPYCGDPGARLSCGDPRLPNPAFGCCPQGMCCCKPPHATTYVCCPEATGSDLPGCCQPRAGGAPVCCPPHTTCQIFPGVCTAA